MNDTHIEAAFDENTSTAAELSDEVLQKEELRSDLQPELPQELAEASLSCDEEDADKEEENDLKEAEEPHFEAPVQDVGELLQEIKRLKSALAERDAMAERFAKEGEEFYALYPQQELRHLPDAVWKDVESGIPLAAAYALYERRRFCTEQKALEYNYTNMQRSTGAHEATEPDYFSPKEVRAMSQSEVRANYEKIMRSMQKWH